jgi:hypothetical protein
MQARSDLLAFTEFTMPGFQRARHHRLVCDKLNGVLRGEITRLMIMTPPRHTKSELVSTRFPALYLGQNPNDQIIAASYGADLAQDFGRKVRNLISAREFGALFPHVKLASDSSAKDNWHLQSGGVYVAAGVSGGITGKGANVAIVDDPIKGRADAESAVIREKVWDWYRGDLRPRLMPDAAIVLVQTRWHPDDLAGRLIDAMHSGGEQWEIVSLPALATSPEDPLGRAVGEPLWPEWFDKAELDAIHASVGERDWMSLYQQEPQSGTEFFSDIMFLVEGANGPAPIAWPNAVQFVFATVDTTQKGGKGRDGTAVSYWAHQELKLAGQHELMLLDWDIVEHEGGLLDMWFPQVFRRLEELARSTNARGGTGFAMVEDKAAGSILLQQAPRYGWPMKAIDSKLTSVGKDARAINASGYINQGRVKITASAFEKRVAFRGAVRNHWLWQASSFRIGAPEGAEDDLLDTMCYGVALGLGNPEGF